MAVRDDGAMREEASIAGGGLFASGGCIFARHMLLAIRDLHRTR